MKFLLHAARQTLASRLLRWLAMAGMTAAYLLFHTITAHAAYLATQCAADRYGSNLSCTANDVYITSITVVNGPASCVAGSSTTLNLNLNFTFGQPKRFDIGVFVPSDGKNPQVLSSNGGAAICAVSILPPATPFKDLDGDKCGDGNNSITGILNMPNTPVKCQSISTSTTGDLYIPFVVSWDQNAQPGCSASADTVPGGPSKCNAPTVIQGSVGVVVLPAFTLSNGTDTVPIGSTTTYIATITNNTGFALSNIVFKDPAVTGINVTSASCSSAGGASCPAVTSVAGMQGSGLTIPSMPINSVVAFTINATLDGNIGDTRTNTAHVTIRGQTNSASDTDTIGYPVPVTASISPASKFIGEAAFVMTVSGNNFIPESIARFNGLDRATTYISPTQLTVSILASDLTVIGAFNIDVVNPAPGGGVSNAQIFNILPPVSDFSAFESSTAANAIAGSIYTKLAGAAFNLDVVAISNGAKSSSFSGNVKIELLANTGTPGSGYGTNNCPNSGSVIQMIASTAIASGRSTINFAAVANAYRDVRVRISYPVSSPTLIACSTDSFAIRPLAFTVTSTDATNTGKSGAPAIKAGDNFNLTATAIAGYNLAPNVDSSRVTGTNIAGVLSGSFAAAESTTGVAAGSFTYGEAGNFGLNSNAVYDTAFTSIDQGGDCTADHSNTLDSNGKYGCYVGSYAVTQTTGSSGFGRFIPHHFDTAITPGCAAGSFTYSGQPFTVKVTAKNSAGGITQNYNTACGYAKTITLSNAAGSAGNLNIGWPPPATPIQTMASTQFTNPVACGGAMNPPGGPNGEQGNVTFTFPTPETAPVTIALRAVDADGVTSSSFTEGTTEVRSGRIKLSNAHGSELLPLPIPIAFQYYTSNGWVPNTADSCSIISASNFAFSSPGNNLAACETAITVSGSAPAYSLTLAAPGNSNNGWTGLTLNLGAEAAGSTCTAKNGGTGFSGLATTANMPWLQFPWGGAGATNPSARATFGVYKGGNEFIYLRERY